MYRWRDLYLAD